MPGTVDTRVQTHRRLRGCQDPKGSVFVGISFFSLSFLPSFLLPFYSCFALLSFGTTKQ